MFYYNQSSRESRESQWRRYLQTQEHIRTVGDLLTRNREQLQSTLDSASAQHAQAFRTVCGTLERGFDAIERGLESIDSSIEGVRAEVHALASMLDWKLSALIEEQRITNQLLGQAVRLLRIPDSQKQRAYFIEQGLKYLANAIPEGSQSDYYTDAIEAFRQAESLERKDYITLGRIGHILLYSDSHLDVAAAEIYFSKSAREALAEATVGGTQTTQSLSPSSLAPDTFKLAAAEALLYAGRAAYLRGDLTAAANHAQRAFVLMPSMTAAGFDQAKYLAASGHPEQAALVLAPIIEQEPLWAVKTVSDPELGNAPAIGELLKSLTGKKRAEAIKALTAVRRAMREDSVAQATSRQAGLLLTEDSLLACVDALKLLTERRSRSVKSYRCIDRVVGWRYVARDETLLECVERENEGPAQLEQATRDAKQNLRERRGPLALGAVFFLGLGLPVLLLLSKGDEEARPLVLNHWPLLLAALAGWIVICGTVPILAGGSDIPVKEESGPHT